jgi:hypothetical protein
MAKFEPGQSGNPGGRPKSKELRETLRAAYADKAHQRLGELMDDRDSRVALQAVREYYDRVHGRPLQASEITIEDNRAEQFASTAPLTPDEVAISLKELLTTAEKEMGLEPMPMQTNKERVERLLKEKGPLSPSLYTALHQAEGMTRH